MGKMNNARIILGGLLAGLVLNIGEYILNEPILGEDWKAAMKKLNLETGSDVVVWYIVMGFVLGIAAVWLYAAVRPRFGAGPKTALITGLTIWFFVWLWGFGSAVIAGLYPPRIVIITLAWGFFEVPIATLAGAWLYKED